LSHVLGKVTEGAAAEPRGPDVTHAIRVPEAWLANGATIELELPRTLHCAGCDGGGCDACQRAGAISIRERDAASEPLQVALPKSTQTSGRAVMLRIPEAGGPSPLADVPRGLLLLKVLVGSEPDSGVRLLRAAPVRELRAPRQVVVRSLLVAGLLLLTFLWMLHLSGWL